MYVCLCLCVLYVCMHASVVLVNKINLVMHCIVVFN